MESKREFKVGEVHAYGELVAGELILKKYREFKIIECAGSLPKECIRINGGINGTIPIGPYGINLKYWVGADIPIDITRVHMHEAYSELKEIIFLEGGEMHKELMKGIFVNEVQKGDIEVKPPKVKDPDLEDRPETPEGSEDEPNRGRYG